MNRSDLEAQLAILTFIQDSDLARRVEWTDEHGHRCLTWAVTLGDIETLRRKLLAEDGDV